MLIYMQKVNLLIHFLLKLLQRNSKLFFGGGGGGGGVIWASLEETFQNYLQGKINSILYGFLEILQRCYKVVVVGALGMPGHAHPK